MLLTITANQYPATDLGYLLHKNPSRVHTFELSFGKAHVFYPDANPDRCTAAILLDVDPVGLVRERIGPAGDSGSLDRYVNDRPYVVSSFMSVALANAFGTAFSGRSKERQELAETPLPLTARLAVLPCRGGTEILYRLFAPLGYKIEAWHHPLDERFPEWGESSYFTVELQGRVRLCDLLAHLYVLIPVLDAEKHYWVGEAEVEKLLRRGKGWLASHPERELIVNRYLKRRHHLTRDALARLAEEDELDPDAELEEHQTQEMAVEAPLRLWEQRMGAVLSVLHGCAARTVIDLGCGEGRLLKTLLEDRQFERIVGMDVSIRSLERASQRLRMDRLPTLQRDRVSLLQGSLMYRDRRLEGFDAAAIVEVIEHFDSPRLSAFERVVFEQARPKTVIVTTPNSEYNVRFETLPAGQFRHKDHRFEWSRAQFEGWAHSICGRFGYTAKFLPIGPLDPEVGPPTQMGVFNL